MDLLYRQTYLQEDQVALLHKGSDGLVIQKDHLPLVLLYREIRWTAHAKGHAVLYTQTLSTEGSNGTVM